MEGKRQVIIYYHNEKGDGYAEGFDVFSDVELQYHLAGASFIAAPDGAVVHAYDITGLHAHALFLACKYIDEYRQTGNELIQSFLVKKFGVDRKIV